MINETQFLFILLVLILATLFLSVMILTERLNRIKEILFDEKQKRKPKYRLTEDEKKQAFQILRNRERNE